MNHQDKRLEEFGKNLVRQMDEMDFSQKDLADALGVALASVSHWRAGKHWPVGDMVERIADALSCSIDALLAGTGEALVSTLRRIQVHDAARLLGKSDQWVRVGLQQGRLPFGTAVQTGKKGFSYHISPKLLYEYIGSGEWLDRLIEDYLKRKGERTE